MSTEEEKKLKNNKDSESEIDEDPNAPSRPNLGDGDDEEEEETTTTTTTSASNNTNGAKSSSQQMLVYSVEKMLEIRTAMKKAPLLTVEFQQFMKGIAVSIEGNVTTVGAGAPGAAAGSNSKDFFGRPAASGVGSSAASGVGTPFSPGLGSNDGKGGATFPGKGGAAGKGADPALGKSGGGGGMEFTRDALFADVKVAQNAIKERTLLHRVRGIFAKVSHDNFESVKNELCALPIRQSDDKDVREIVHWIYDKAVQPEDEIFVELYANLIKELTNDIQGKDAKKGSALRKALVEKCQQSFDKRSDVAKSSADEISNAQNAETTVESRDSAASAALKAAIANDEDAEYVKQRERSRLRANIKFLAQLFRVHMVTSKVVNYVLYSLLYGAATGSGHRHKPEEYEIEMFIDLIKSTQQLLPAEIREQYLPKYLETVKEYSQSKKVSMRVSCLLEDLVELAANGWMSREERRKKGLLGTNPNAPAPHPLNSAYVPPGQRGGSGSFPAHGGNSGDNTNPTPPYSPIVNGPPAYPPPGGRGGRGRGGLASPNVAIPNSQQQQMQQQAAAAAAAQQLPPNANKDTFITVITKYKDNEFGKKEIIDHFTVLPHALKSEHIWNWVEKSFKMVRKSEDRKLLSQIIQIMIESKLCRNTLGYDLMNQLAPNVVSEVEDNPKIFECWADFMQSKYPSIIPLACNSILLRQLVKDEDVEFSTIEKMLTDVVTASQPNIKDFITTTNANPHVDTALHRFRMLPIILNCTREDNGEEDAYGMSGSYGGSTMNNEASGTNNGDDDAGPAPVPIPQRKDLLAYLLTHPSRPRAETNLSTELELDIFGILTNFDNTSQANLAAVMKKAKNHTQRSDPSFYAGFFCAIFCYLRMALVTGEKTDFDKIRELLTLLKVPGENTQLFMRECYMTYCELGSVPAGSFQTLLEVFCPGNQQPEMKQFNEWRSKNQWSISGITGRPNIKPGRQNSNNY